MRRVLYWFRNDLRLNDNPALSAALEAAESIAFVYVHDPSLMQETCAGIPRLGWHRRRFLRESLTDLRESLRKHGFFLIELHGSPEEILPELVLQNDIDCLSFSKECGPEEKAVENQLFLAAHMHGFDIRCTWTQFLIGPDALPFPLTALPQKFTEFRLKVESVGLAGLIPPERAEQLSPLRLKPLELRSQNSKISHLIDICNASVTSLSYQLQTPLEKELLLLKRIQKDTAPVEKMKILKGGAEAAERRLENYLFASRSVEHYYSTRNGLLNPSDSTLFSAWLANGSMSAPMVFRSIVDFEKKFIANKSTYWVVFELLWREFFKLHLLRAGVAFFHPQGLYRRNTDKHVNLSQDDLQERIAMVLSCQTEDEFINANLRELFQTGYMSNRGRQNVASYLIYDLQIPWHWGAWVFESFLVDYDVASNWGNWAYIAGVSFDPRGGRQFNTIKQRQDYDPDGTYVAAWTAG